MSAPEYATLVRMFVRLEPGGLPEDAIDSDKKAQVVCEAEAGPMLLASGALYRISIVVKDVTSSATMLSENKTGSLGDANWVSPSVEFSFTLPPQGSGQKGHIYQTIASLIVGIADPTVSFIESPLFIIT